MRGNPPVRFGKGPSEKDPNHGHLAGGLLHTMSPSRITDIARAALVLTHFEHGLIS
jgi:hypothetical protein